MQVYNKEGRLGEVWPPLPIKNPAYKSKAHTGRVPTKAVDKQ